MLITHYTNWNFTNEIHMCVWACEKERNIGICSKANWNLTNTGIGSKTITDVHKK